MSSNWCDQSKLMPEKETTLQGISLQSAQSATTPRMLTLDSVLLPYLQSKVETIFFPSGALRCHQQLGGNFVLLQLFQPIAVAIVGFLWRCIVLAEMFHRSTKFPLFANWWIFEIMMWSGSEGPVLAKSMSVWSLVHRNARRKPNGFDFRHNGKFRW